MPFLIAVVCFPLRFPSGPDSNEDLFLLLGVIFEHIWFCFVGNATLSGNTYLALSGNTVLHCLVVHTFASV